MESHTTLIQGISENTGSIKTQTGTKNCEGSDPDQTRQKQWRLILQARKLVSGLYP